MTNETNEQKPEVCKVCHMSFSIQWNKNEEYPEVCPKCGQYEHELPPQEVEAKGWRYGLASYQGDKMLFGIWSPEAIELPQLFRDEKTAKFLTDSLNELSRLRSSMGKVPSDVDAEEYHNCLDREKYPEARIDHHYAGFMLGAKWMRSEVAPVIARLENLVHEKSEENIGLSYKLDTAESELKQAKEALHDNMQYYMEYCQRNGYVTPKDWIEKHKHF